MKKLISLFAAAAVVACTFGQTPRNLARETVGNVDILKNWSLGETKYVDNTSIQRVAGENDIHHRTNVFYTSNKSMKRHIEDKAHKEMLSGDRRNAMEEAYLQNAPGGQLSVFFDRNSEMLANPALFTVLVKDAAGNVIFQEALDSERPYYYKWGIWYCYTTINLPVNAGEKFSVEVVDAGLSLDFTFMVTNWDNAGENPKFVPITGPIF